MSQRDKKGNKKLVENGAVKHDAENNNMVV
jgi:hypothetical protein